MNITINITNHSSVLLDSFNFINIIMKYVINIAWYSNDALVWCNFMNTILMNIIKNINFFGHLVDWLSLVSTISIAIFGWRLSERQQQKTLEDNKINRLANFNSNVILDDEQPSAIICHIDTLYNYSMVAQTQNVLLSNKIVHEIGTAYSISINLSFKSIGNIIPTLCKFEKIILYDTTIDKNKQKETEQAIMEFFSYNSEFKSLAIKDKDSLNTEVLCCISEEEYKKIVNYDYSNRNLNIVIDLNVKNQFGIVSNCQICGLFKPGEKKNVGTSSLGSQKEKTTLKLERVSLMIKSTYEEESK